MRRPPSAVWLFHKAVGQTSASLVQAFRDDHLGNFSLKVSHGGVLDPFAEGLVVLLVGAANRLFEALHEAPKRYVATVAWGRETDTGDGGGRTIDTGAPPTDPRALDAALQAFRGWTDQIPPTTSNKRVGGERAYQRAHRGEVFELPPSAVYLHEARWVRHELPERSELELVVRGGFYVRSVVRDVARALGTRAHVEALKRTHVGPWSAGNSPRCLTGADVLPWLPSVSLSDDAWGQLRRDAALSGAVAGPQRAPPWPLPQGFPSPKSGVRAFHRDRLVALLRAEDATLLPGGI